MAFPDGNMIHPPNRQAYDICQLLVANKAPKAATKDWDTLHQRSIMEQIGNQLDSFQFRNGHMTPDIDGVNCLLSNAFRRKGADIVIWCLNDLLGPQLALFDQKGA